MTKKSDAELPPRLLTLEDARQALGCSLKTLRRRVEDGALAVIRDGRLIRVHPDDLQRYIQQRRYG
jgi:excisionase family DNA binding protein